MAPKLQRMTRDGMIAGPNAHGSIPEVSSALHGLSGVLPRLIEVDVDMIDDDPHQARTVFDEGALRSLALSIESHGLQQPILVREGDEPGRWRLVAGERRLRAHRMLARETIAAILTKGKPEEIALIENVQRVDLDVFDLAKGMRRLMETHGYTQAETAAVVGCSPNEASRRLKVLDLPEKVREEFRAAGDAVSRSALYEVVAVDDEAERLRLWSLARKGATVQKLREAARPREERPSPEPIARLGKAVVRIGKDIDTVESLRDALRGEHRERLRELRDRLDVLIAE